MAKAKGFDDSDDEYENENETIETIMAKARAFEDTDESEILNWILEKVKAFDYPGRWRLHVHAESLNI